MEFEVFLPKVGMAMQDAVIVNWFKKAGEKVRKGDPLFEMETEKVVETVESPASGILEKILFPMGETVEVDSVVAIIRVEEGAPVSAAPQDIKTPEAAPKPVVEPAAGKGADELSPHLGSVLPFSRMRQTIARRMSDSLAKTAQITLMTEVDVTELAAKREKDLKDLEITYTDIFVSVVAKAIERFPMMNSRLENDRIEIPAEINIGLAVALEEGLVVPVIKQANTKSLAELRSERTRLVNACRNGTHTSEDVSGGTFTITNLGMYGIDLFTPIINLPETVILGLGRIQKKAVVIKDQVQIRSMIGLSLTVDHRVIDGAVGAEFLAALSKALETADF